MAQHSFKFAEKSEELNAVKTKALAIMEANEQYKTVLQNIQNDLSEKEKTEKDGKLRITFIGAYSAGKSTIISTLTGNNDIKIDSNISTTSTTTYPWQDVLLVDTPGLNTHYPEHDAETEKAIKRADIVVYCLTYSLFDDLLLKDFKNLAYERGYSGKMLLVVNKMNAEYTGLSYEETVTNYKKDLAKALGKKQFTKFPLSFIAAELQSDPDSGMRKESHFDDFIVHLNDFISANGQMAKILGPANIFIDNIQQGIIENNDSENREFFQILDSVDRKFKKQERKCDSSFRSLIDKLRAKIINMAPEFVNMEHESQLDYEEHCRKVEQEMEQYCNSAVQDLENTFESVQKELNSALLKVSKGELVQNYYAACKIKPEKISSGGIIKNNTTVNVKMLNKIFSNARKSSSAVKAAGEGVKATGLLKSAGFWASFKPLQAAKGIGNFTKVLGPLMIAASLAIEVADAVHEEQREKKEQECRRNVLAEFSEQANYIVQQFEGEYRKYKEQAIGKNLKMIKEIRNQRANEVELTDKTAKELKSCIEDFKRLLSEG